MGTDDETSTTTTPSTIYYGPRGTEPGGTWFRRVDDPKQQGDCCQDDCGPIETCAAVLCICFICCSGDCDCAGCGDCCPSSQKKDAKYYVYLDPRKNVLINEQGHQVPVGNDDCDKPVTEAELRALQDKYRPDASMERE